MSKNPNSKSKPVKRDEPMNGAMKFFLAGCVAELYLLVVRRFFINGNLEQVVAWDGYLMILTYVGLAVLAAGLVLGILWKREKRRFIGWWVFAGGAFLAGASVLCRMFVGPAVTLLCVVVPVAMLLGILWTLYDRECAWSLTIMGVSLIILWVCRREMSSMYWGTLVKAGAVIAILLLAAAAFLARQASRHHGKLGKLQVLSADSDVLPIYVACGLSAAALVTALISAAVAYYAMWAMALVVFALAVYYTVKQL